MWRAVLVAAVALSAGITSVVFAAERQHSDDPRLLDGAVADIAQMPPDELNAFTQYLAECGSEGDPDHVVQHRCGVARSLYQMRFGQEGAKSRSVDKLIYARVFEAAAETAKVRSQPLPLPTANQVTDDALRYGQMMARIESAVRERFRQIRSRSASP